MDRGVQWATVHGVAELETSQQLNNNCIFTVEDNVTQEVFPQVAWYLMSAGSHQQKQFAHLSPEIVQVLTQKTYLDAQQDDQDSSMSSLLFEIITSWH